MSDHRRFLQIRLLYYHFINQLKLVEETRNPKAVGFEYPVSNTRTSRVYHIVTLRVKIEYQLLTAVYLIVLSSGVTKDPRMRSPKSRLRSLILNVLNDKWLLVSWMNSRGNLAFCKVKFCVMIFCTCSHKMSRSYTISRYSGVIMINKHSLHQNDLQNRDAIYERQSMINLIVRLRGNNRPWMASVQLPQRKMRTISLRKLDL
jgi:hypothetical protein